MAIGSFATLTDVANIQFSIHVKETSTLQLIKDISNDLQNHSNILMAQLLFLHLLIVLSVLLTNFDLYSNDEEYATVTLALFFISSLLNCH